MHKLDAILAPDRLIKFRKFWVFSTVVFVVNRCNLGGSWGTFSPLEADLCDINGLSFFK